MVDSVYRMRSLGVAAAGIPDQYADGKAAKVWELYIGSKIGRTAQYKDWLQEVLVSHECSTVLDVACGTGVDSAMLVENGYSVTSTDASDKMLKYALKERWEKRTDEKYDKWVIEEANWLSLTEDLENRVPQSGGWDAVICLGNSFAHLPDFHGDLQNQKLALSNMRDLLKPGGVLIIDHRNYDAILDFGTAPSKNIYYNSDHIVEIKTSNLYVNGKPSLVTLDYKLDITRAFEKQTLVKEAPPDDEFKYQTFRLSYYPHRLKTFSGLLSEVFGAQAQHTVYGDFKKYNPEDVPSYYVHVIVKDSN